MGFGNTGTYNMGFGNSGTDNTGSFNSGNFNTGWGNSGDTNTGFFNSGNLNTGFDSSVTQTGPNSGFGNTGSGNSGFFNQGLDNSGYSNSNTGSGCHKTGFFNSGSGMWDIGFGNSGSGLYNTGFFNSGSGGWNSGFFNSGSDGWNSGFFNSGDLAGPVLLAYPVRARDTSIAPLSCLTVSTQQCTIVDVGRITLHAGDIPPDLFDGLVQRVLPSARDQDVTAVQSRTGAVEAFHDGPHRPPWLVYLFFALIVIGPIAVARSSSLDELLADRRTLAELLISQTARWLGCVFLVLEVGGQLPGFFAYPAAFGDITVGVSACVAVIALIWSTSTSIPVAWSVLGLLDFVGAVGTAFLATQALAIVHTDPPTSVFTQWPMVLFPAYLVPFSIILHITTIRVLLRQHRTWADYPQDRTYVRRHVLRR